MCFLVQPLLPSKHSTIGGNRKLSNCENVINIWMYLWHALSVTSGEVKRVWGLPHPPSSSRSSPAQYLEKPTQASSTLGIESLPQAFQTLSAEQDNNGVKKITDFNFGLKIQTEKVVLPSLVVLRQ